VKNGIVRIPQPEATKIAPTKGTILKSHLSFPSRVVRAIASLALSLIAAAVAAGCSSTTDPGADACARAVAHVESCPGAPAVTATGCDRDAAEALLATSCADLASARDTKADFASTLRALACDAGVIRFCEVPACDAPRFPELSTVCADYIAIPGCGGCQFYACREAAGQCGASGYYLGYAEKYCERFLATLRPRMSPAGQQFLDRGRDCLMRFVDEQLAPDDACDDVKQRAFASHVACYHDNGFCELPLRDRALLISAVDPADLDLSAAFKTALSCF
jgi:hypothetical protein